MKDPSVLLQMPAAEFSLPDEDDLLRACRAALRRRTEADALDANAAFSELVSNGMLVIYYQRCRAVTNAFPFFPSVSSLVSYNLYTAAGHFQPRPEGGEPIGRVIWRQFCGTQDMYPM